MAKFPARIASIALLLLTAPAFADDGASNAPTVPNNVIAFGQYFVFYHVHASDITGLFAPTGLGINVKDSNTPYFAYLRRLSTHLYLELAGGIPPVTKIVGKGSATVGAVPYNNVEISTARSLSPSLLIKYVFFDETHIVRPYLAIGANFVEFYDRDTTPPGNAAAGGPTRIELSNSLGVVGTVGLTVALPHYWGLMLSYSEARVRTRLHAITDDVVRTASIDFNPGAIVFATTYAF